MDANFWHERWANRDTPFHASEANPLLVEHFPRLQLSNGSRVFVPLCGKTLDIGWLLSQGHSVVGIELSPLAVEQLFAELKIQPQRTAAGELERFHAEGIDILVGDFFAVTRESLGPVDAVYDRAALVALPQEMRIRYAQSLVEITSTAPQLLICFEYDQAAMPGPPFCVDSREIQSHYSRAYNLALLDSPHVPGGLKGKCSATENVWLLTPKQV